MEVNILSVDGMGHVLIGNEIIAESTDKILEALLNIKDVRNGKKSDLFASDGVRINLQVTGIRLPIDSLKQIIKIRLPHFPCQSRETCLIVKDIQRGIRPDHENTHDNVVNLLRSKNVTQVTKVMPLRELKVEYKPYEAKRLLCHSYDTFIADARIIRLLPKFLGSAFYKRKIFPLQVNMLASNLRKEIDNALHTVTLPLKNHGVCSMVQVGNTNMSKQYLSDNLNCIVETLKRRYPGGWKNIRCLHIKTEFSMAIPIYTSTISANDVGVVKTNLGPGKPKKRRAVCDELSTIPGAMITVAPDGNIEIKTPKDDPLWDYRKKELMLDDDGESEVTFPKVANVVSLSREEIETQRKIKKMKKIKKHAKKEDLAWENKNNNRKGGGCLNEEGPMFTIDDVEDRYQNHTVKADKNEAELDDGNILVDQEERDYDCETGKDTLIMKPYLEADLDSKRSEKEKSILKKRLPKNVRRKQRNAMLAKTRKNK